MTGLIFKNAEAAKDAIMASQKKEIAALYEKWADEIGEKAKFYSHKSTASSVVSERQMKELKKQLRATSQQVSNEVYKKIKTNMYVISDAVVADNVKWLESFGFSPDGLNAAFNYVPDSIVRNIVTGQIYDSGWSLSKAIWSDNEKALKDIYEIVGKGIAQNMPIYEIAKNLEAYVSPSKRKLWNLKAPDGVKIFKKTVDYNAQRLARTLVQHSYQQSFVATTQKNPFITEYIWHSNGSRVCEICLARDGAHFKKDELPMDHPNGMCTMEPVVAKDMVDQLADWFNSPDGTYPEIDAFAGNFGYKTSANEITNNLRVFKEKFGNSLYSDKLKTALGDNYDEGKKIIISEYYKNGYSSTVQFLDDYYEGKIKSSLLDDLFSGKTIINKSTVSTTKKAAAQIVKKSSNVVNKTVSSKTKISNVDTSNISSKKVSGTIQSAFDAIKQDSRLATNVDDVLKDVRYAQGNMSNKMVRQNTGAMVQGKTLWIERSTQKYVDKDFITHEIGHKVTKYGEKMTDATAKKVAEELAKELGYKDVKSMSLYVSDYAAKNPTELFPEAFMEYYSGKELRGNKKKIVEAIMNKMYFK